MAANNEHTLTLSGELDLASAPQLSDAIARICADSESKSILLDLRNVSFLDSSGMRGLVLGSLFCDEHGKGLRILPGPLIRRRLEMMGLAERLTIENAD